MTIQYADAGKQTQVSYTRELPKDIYPEVNVVWECCCQQWQGSFDKSPTECPVAAWGGIEGVAVWIQVASIRNRQD